LRLGGPGQGQGDNQCGLDQKAHEAIRLGSDFGINNQAIKSYSSIHINCAWRLCTMTLPNLVYESK
jgi:hypothetical protein